MKLTRERRLQTWGEFQGVKKARRSSGGKFLVVSAARVGEGETRYGLITSKKVGIAVVRNTIRRRLRQIIRATGDEVKKGHHIVTIARWNAASASYAELEKDWKKQIRKLDLSAASEKGGRP